MADDILNGVICIIWTVRNGNEAANDIQRVLEINIAKFNIKTVAKNCDLIHSIYLFINESYVHIFIFLVHTSIPRTLLASESSSIYVNIESWHKFSRDS